jgi:hypothetical protein
MMAIRENKILSLAEDTSSQDEGQETIEVSGMKNVITEELPTDL